MKKLLRKILPAPAETFHRRMDAMERLIKKQFDLLQKKATKDEELTFQARDSAALRQAENDLSGRVREHLERLSAREEQISARSILWANEYERKTVCANWEPIEKGPEFAQRYQNLIRGLDANSIQIIVRILARHERYLATEEKTINLFSQKEQQMIRALNENFYPEIIQLSDELYAYQHYLLPIDYFEPGIFYYRLGLDGLRTLGKVSGKAIIDVGAYIGDTALVLSELPACSIYCFEAVPENYSLMQTTIRLNHLDRVVAENLALGADSGTLKIRVDGPCSTSVSQTIGGEAREVEVPLTTLDAYVAQHNLEIGLIKVDIEGGEPDFLIGAKQTICRQRPILLISIYHNTHDFFELKPMIESWNLGYTFHIHKPVFRNATSEVLLCAECTSEEENELKQHHTSLLAGTT